MKSRPAAARPLRNVESLHRPRRRRIAVVTGTRAEYGLLKSVLHAVAADPRLELQLVATGMHLLRKFGRTVDEITRDGFRVAARVPMQSGADQPLDQAAGLGRGIAGIAAFLERAASDVVVVLGDRIEALAGALAGVTTGRVVAHIHGGDVAPGDFDDALRHALTKLAHLHFAATRAAARRILRLGERPEHVHVVGAPGLDRLRELLAERRGPRAVAAPYALVVQHAHGRSAAVEDRTMTTILRTIAAAGLRRVIVYPNSDRGHTGVIRAIERHRGARGGGEVTVFRSLPRDDYLRALLGAAVLVGNSSSGIIEAPLAGTPSIDIGSRQAGRQPGGRSVLAADESGEAIGRALRRALRMRVAAGRRSVYGDGRAGARIAQLLADTALTSELVHKQIAY